MNKRITSLLLCLVMIVSLLVTAVPVFAAGSVKFTMTSDKAKASPGDTITYTVTMGEVSRFDSLKYKLSIPEGLTFVAGSGKLADNLKETLNCVDTAWTESTKVFYITLCSDGIGYTSTTPTELMTFQCKVDDGATGSLKIEFIIEPNNCYDSDYDNIAFTTETPSITITAAPKPATGITLNKSELTLTAGDSDTSLTATVTPSDSTDTVVWSTDEPAVATVDSATGKVTAVAPGEAIITATAGTKTATCTVKVQAAPCTHDSLTPFPEKDSNCTEKGWDAYKKCDLCGKLFDMNDNPIAEIPYRALNDDHDFNTSEWGYKEADGHAHVCNRNAEHHDTVQPHTPDHEGGATYEYAVKCTECGRVLEAQLEAGKIRIEVPFKLTVKKTGEMDPGKETFKFVIEDFCAPVDFVLVQDTIDTNGEKTYDGKFIFEIPENMVRYLAEGFVIRQVKGNAEGWTYDETKFYAMPMFADTYANVADWRFLKYDENAEPDYNNPIEEIGFTNSYYAKKPETPPTPPKPGAPETGETSMAVLWIALLFVSGAALTGAALYGRKKRANNR